MPKQRSGGGPESPRVSTIRTFIAASLPAHIVEHVETVQASLRSAGVRAKWVRASNMHLTLKFLGNIDENEVAAAGRAMGECIGGRGPMTLRAKGVGLFPGLRRPRVIWVGLSGETEALADYQKALEDALESFGFPKENRPFSAHLTVARIRERIDLKKLSDMVERLEKLASEPFEVDRITLFKSDLRPEGPLYTSLFSHILQGP